MELKIIITGITGMVGEGVMLECLDHPDVHEVLSVSRRHYDLQHPKLKQLIVPDFMQLDNFKQNLSGYDACFYCAGVSSLGLNEEQYTHTTYDIPLHFAKVLSGLNPEMTFGHISGALTDSSEKGKVMWARVKGKAENDLMKLPIKAVYSFRPGFMKPVKGQKNVKGYYKIVLRLFPVLIFLFPTQGSTLKELALAMINSVKMGYTKSILEIKDIKLLAGR